MGVVDIIAVCVLVMAETHAADDLRAGGKQLAVIRHTKLRFFKINLRGILGERGSVEGRR